MKKYLLLFLFISGCAIPSNTYTIGPIRLNLPKDGKFIKPEITYSNKTEYLHFKAAEIVATNAPATLTAQGRANEALINATANGVAKGIEAYRGQSVSSQTQTTK